MTNYPTYKESGEYWMGKIPHHWETKKLKHLFTEKKITHNLDLGCGAISFGEVIPKNDDKVPESTKASYQEVLVGEFLVNPLNLNYDLKSLRIALSKINVVVSSGYIVLKDLGEINRQYYKYLLHRYDVAYMKLLGSGVRQTISFNHIANSLLAYPPLKEQTTIANFLDDKTAKIDQAIAQKEKLIALLKERKQIVIQQAVTGKTVWSEKEQAFVPLSESGAEGKDSGVEWIGEIPEGWEVKKMAYLTSKIGDGLHGTPEYTDNTEYYFINGNNLSSGFIAINEQTKTVSKKEYLLHKKNLIYGQTLLLSINGTIGNVAFYRGEKVILGKSAAYLNFNHDINLEFIKWFLTSDNFKKYYQLELSGSTINNFSLYSIGKTPIIYPSMKEQELIVEHLKSNCAKIDQAITLQQAQIEKLKEYKATLIDSAVTGKIKVN